MLPELWKYKIVFSWEGDNRINLEVIYQGINLLAAIRSNTCCCVLLVGVGLVLETLLGTRLFSRRLTVSTWFT